MNELLVYPRVLAVHTLYITEGSKLDKVLIPDVIFGKEDLVMAGIPFFFAERFSCTIRSDIEFTTDYRFYF